MAKIANVALTNTFDYWRLRSNESFDRLSQFAINNSKLYANTLIANNVLKSLGNTVLGAAGKRTVVNGLLSANGRVTITTNLDVTGNTSSNKLTVTTSLRSTGNNVLGAAAKVTVVEGLLNSNGRVLISNSLRSTGNNVLGASGKKTVVEGLLSANGRATVATNLDVTGNTSSNKLTVTTSLRSTGNNVLGASGKTAVVNGVLNANGRVTVASNLTVTGNTSANKVTVTSALVSSGNTTVAGLIANNSLGTANYVLKTNGNTVFWAPASSGGQTNVFSAIAVSGQNTLFADGPNDTLNLAAGYGISISTTNSTDTATIRATNILASNAYSNATFAGKQSPATSGLHAHTGRSTISQNLVVSGNTVFGAASKKSVINGLLQANGRINVVNNVDVTGNTSSNKLTVTSSLRSTGNNVLGAAAKVTVVNGLLNANGRATIATNLSVTGNTSANKVTVTSALLGSTANAQVLALGVGATPGSNGTIRATNDITAYYSDERLKIKLGPILDPVGMVRNLSGFYFEANELAQKLGYERKREVGVSAQEVQSVLPEVVVPAPIDENYLTVKYEKLVPLLIEAIKVLDARLTALENK